ncbi:MAG: DUF3108 domain-containing protein [Bradyrhizobiaceae bacterium]|nr:DUF3108 domain-containing protein [Bradyrhizobiaceae bacterium]
MRRSRFCFGGLASALLAASPALAGGALEARYTVSFTGLQIGQAALVVHVNDDSYSAAGSGMVTGVLQLVTGGKGTASARGKLIDGRISPVNYSANSETDRKSEELRLAGAAGAIWDEKVEPRPEAADRIPVTDEHRTGAVDPMSALLMPVAGTGDLTGPAACDRTLPIYDGRQRYDLEFIYLRTEAAKDVKGYSGPLAVCRVQYRPVAGHRPNRKSVKELIDNKDIFVWLAPVAGTRMLVPQRVSFGTKLGTFVMHATYFSSEARPSRQAPAIR